MTEGKASQAASAFNLFQSVSSRTHTHNCFNARAGSVAPSNVE